MKIDSHEPSTGMDVEGTTANYLIISFMLNEDREHNESNFVPEKFRRELNRNLSKLSLNGESKQNGPRHAVEGRDWYQL